jgi:hypothetical protein
MKIFSFFFCVVFLSGCIDDRPVQVSPDAGFQCSVCFPVYVDNGTRWHDENAGFYIGECSAEERGE